MEQAKDERAFTLPDPREVWEQRKRDELARQAKAQQAWRQELDDLLRIPPRFRGLSMETYPYPQAPWVRAIRDWAQSTDPKGLYIAGPAGAGKTALGLWALKERALRILDQMLELGSLNERQGRAIAQYIGEPQLLTSGRPGGDAELYAASKEARLALLDDFGTAKLSEWGYEQLYSWIDYRHSYELTTIITTNVDLADEGKVDARLEGRIYEMCHIVEVPGDFPSLRHERRQSG